MRLLPKTGRATWTLATAVWLAECTGIWSVLPYPSRVITPTDAVRPVGFPGERRLVAACQHYFNLPRPCEHERRGPFCVWDVETARMVASWHVPAGAIVPLPHDGEGDILAQSALVLYYVDTPGGRHAHLHNLLSGQRESVPLTDFEKGYLAHIAVGGRYLVCETGPPDSPAVSWCDRTTLQVVSSFRGVGLVYVGPDGHWVTEERASRYRDAERLRRNDDHCYVVREPITGRECGRVFLPYAYIWEERWGAEQNYIWSGNDKGWQVFDTRNGRPCLPAQPGRLVTVLAELHQAVSVISDDEEWLVRWDLTSGQQIGRRRVPSGFSFASAFGRHAEFGAVDSNDPLAAAREFLAGLPGIGRIVNEHEPSRRVLLYDVATDQEVATLYPPGLVYALSPDGRTLVTRTRNGKLQFLDMPPRKSLTLFVVAAFIGTVPVVWLAHRHVRTLPARARV